MAPAAKADAAMLNYDARLASFYPSAGESSTKAHARSDSSSAAASISRLPFTSSTHPHLTPTTLASAGFFFAPSAGEPDNCTCFLCLKTLSGWDAQDDPFWEHWQRRAKCAWASVVCGVRWASEGSGRGAKEPIRYTTPDALPQSEQMNKARALTFGKATWPHRLKRSFLSAKPSVLAEAGFVYTPSAEDTDCVTCVLCQHSVSAWEATDSPWDIHGKKHPDCPFFTAVVGDAVQTLKQIRDSQPSGSNSKAAPAASTKKPSRSAKAKAALPLSESQASVDAYQSQPPASPAKSAPAAKASKTRAPASRARGKQAVAAAAHAAQAAQAAQVVSESEKENDPPEDEVVPVYDAPAPTTKGKASRSKAAAGAKSGRGRKTVTAASAAAAAVAPVETESEADQTPAENAHASPESTRIATAAPDAAAEDHDMEVGQPEAEGPAAPIKKGRGTTRTTAKAPRTTSAKAARSTRVAATGKAGKKGAKAVPVGTEDAEAEPLLAASTSTTFVTDQTATTTDAETDPETDPEDPARTPRQQAKTAQDGEYVKQAALEARSVLDNLGATSARRTPKALPVKQAPARPMAAPAIHDPFHASAPTPDTATPPEDLDLTDEQGEMTVEEFLRYELGLRYDELQAQGERSIAEWIERSAKAREVIAGL